MKLFCLFFAGIVYAQTEPKRDCGKNAEWRCATPCQITCSNMNSPVGACVPGCRDGCYCNYNYFRNYAGICVRKGECFSCPANSTYSKCALNSQRTCNFQPVYNPPCTEDCHTQGCNCDEGYVKDHNSGRCILELDCPRPDCPKNMTYTPCANSCQNVCNREPRFCAAECRDPNGACICTGEYFRGPKGNCILQRDCPKL